MLFITKKIKLSEENNKNLLKFRGIFDEEFYYKREPDYMDMVINKIVKEYFESESFKEKIFK